LLSGRSPQNSLNQTKGAISTRFSRKYESYEDWLGAAKPRKSEYAKGIIWLHEKFPELTLKELREIQVQDYSVAETPWNDLESQDKRDRILAFQVLRAMRQGESLTSIVKDLGISKQLDEMHLGEALFKENKRWRVAPTDSIEAEMTVYEKNRGIAMIVTAGSEDRSMIGKYFAAVQKVLDKKDLSGLPPFEDFAIIDASGNSHRLETDPETLYELEFSIEEPEFFEIYAK